MKMTHFIGAIATVGLGLSLGGCGLSGVGDVNALRTMTAQGGTPFTRALSDEYRMEANDEAYVEAEWGDAGWFARKALQAAAGEAVAPADPATLTGWHWTVPEKDRLAMLTEGRSQLLTVLTGDTRDRMPAKAAHVQRLFDCWAEEEAEGEQNSACGEEFRKLIAELLGVRSYSVYFERDSSAINGEARRVIRQAAESASRSGIRKISVTGHTDTTGGNAYNLALSERRAQAVRSELIHDGLPGSNVHVVGVGEDDPLVPTQDGVNEAKNRRAVIMLQK